MKDNNNTLLIVGLLGVAGLGAIMFMNSQKQAQQQNQQTQLLLMQQQQQNQDSDDGGGFGLDDVFGIVTKVIPFALGAV